MAAEESMDQPGKFGALENKSAEINLSEYAGFTGVYSEVIYILDMLCNTLFPDVIISKTVLCYFFLFFFYLSYLSCS